MPATGTIKQVIGSTFDAEFPENAIPEIFNAVTVDFELNGQKQTLVGEVAKHLGGGQGAIVDADVEEGASISPVARAVAAYAKGGVCMSIDSIRT